MLQLAHYNPSWITHIPIAHRGLHDVGVPENSLAAFEAAARAGYGIEFDIRLSADKQLVILHDASTGRMTAQRLTVSKRPASELTHLTLLETQQHIPLLDEALGAIGGRVPILIEVKKNIPMHTLGPLLIQSLQHYHGEIAVGSFDPRVLYWLRRHAPSIPRVQIAGSLPDSPAPSLVRKIFRSMPFNAWTRPNAIVFDYRDIPNKTLEFWCKKLNIPVILWTISTTRDLERAREQGYNFGFDNVRP
jgi:glycerophosphoryl diester phosphodiesterase